MHAKTFDSGFPEGHDTYNGMAAASDGCIYYVLCSALPDVAARMFRHDPGSGAVTCLGDLTSACGEAEQNRISQGKSHVNFVEHAGKLYFATHTGFYQIIDDMEKMGVPPPGFAPYSGGHLLAYDMASGQFEDLATEPHGDGVLTFNADPVRGRLYGITWPMGRFFRYDLGKRDWRDFGGFFEGGEHGRGPAFRAICRALAVDPRDGSVYFTCGEGTILRYDFASESIAPLAGEDLRKDYFGLYDPASPGHMAYNWRQVVWREQEQVFYGVHGNSGYLFRFDPRVPRVDLIERLTSLPSRRSGMFDQFSYGYLGFTLGPDGKTIYYLTGGPAYVDGKRVRGKDSTGKGEAKGLENLHLVTYDLDAGRYCDHGAIVLENGDPPTYVNSIAVGRDGSVYTLARVDTKGGRTDLVRIQPAARI
ncbi:MAG: hypothetical protein U0Q16_05250 [Bryobacteraceae bacterium]